MKPAAHQSIDHVDETDLSLADGLLRIAITLAYSANKLAPANPQELLKKECLLRTAIGRAYYAAYHHCLRYAQDALGFEQYHASDDHRRLKMVLQDHRIRQHVKLETLRKIRNDAEYDEEYGTREFCEDLELACANAIAMAKEIVTYVR